MNATVFLKRLLISVAVVVIVLVVISFTLPRNYQIQRSITIANTDSAVLYNAVADLNSWPQWASWFQNDPNMQVVFGSQTQGAGATLSWVSPAQGRGELEIISVEPNRSVQYRVRFLDYDMQAVGTLSLEPSEQGIQVIWQDRGDLGNNPVNRYLGLFLDSMIGPSLKEGLNKLAEFADKKPNTAN